MSEEAMEELELSPVEEKAIDRGWRPKEEWDGEPSEWVDAGEFLRRGELMDTISTLNRKDKVQEDRIARLEKALRDLGEHNKKIAEQEREKVLSELKAQKARALEEENYDVAVDIDERIFEVKEAEKRANQPEPSTTPKESNKASSEDFEKWVVKNTWYAENLAMRGAADAFAMDFVKKHPEAQGDAKAILDYVSREMEKEFPEQLGKKRKPSVSVDPSEPSGRTRATSSNKRYTARHLNDEQRKIGETLVKAGAFDKMQEYVDQLAELGEIG